MHNEYLTHTADGRIGTYLGPGLHAPHALAALVVALLPHRRPLVLVAGTAHRTIVVATGHLAALDGRVPAVAAGSLAGRPLRLAPLRTGLVAAAPEQIGQLQAVGGALGVIHIQDVVFGVVAAPGLCLFPLTAHRASLGIGVDVRWKKMSKIPLVYLKVGVGLLKYLVLLLILSSRWNPVLQVPCTWLIIA